MIRNYFGMAPVSISSLNALNGIDKGLFFQTQNIPTGW
jgi:hypothetical protein